MSYTYKFLISESTNFIGINLFKDKVSYARDGVSINTFGTLDEAKKYLVDSLSSITSIDMSQAKEIN